MTDLPLSLLGILALWSNRVNFEITSREAVDDIFQFISSKQEILTLIYFGELQELAPYITISSGVPKVVITNPIRNLEFFDGCGFNNQMVFVAIGKLQYNALWNYMYETFKNVQGFVKGIFIVPQTEKCPVHELKSHFSWCWRNGFSEVLVLCETQNEFKGFRAFSFTPYPDINVSRIEISHKTNYFNYKLKDLKGTKIYTPLQFDPPRVFTELPRANNSKIQGYAAKLFTTFLEKHNGILEPLYDENDGIYKIKSIISRMLNDEISFSMHPYFPIPNIHITYPIYMMRLCLMVPFKGAVPTYQYFLQPFQTETWLMLAFLLCTVSCIHSLSQFASSGGIRKIDFWRSFIINIKIFTFQPTPIPHLSQIPLPYAFFLLLIIFLGFMLTNLYLATITSTLTTSLVGKQINTLNDVVHENLTVLMGEYEALVFLKHFELPRGFSELMSAINESTLIHDILTLKPGAAYVAGEDLINFSLMQLKYLKQAPFRLAHECISTLPMGFLLPSHSQFETGLNFFIMYCEAAGLTNVWYNNLYLEGSKAGILKIQQQQDLIIRPLYVGDFQFHFMVLGFGLTLSLLVFALEHFRTFLSRLRFIIILFF